MPDEKGKALLSDIGTEELGHVEMISTMVDQLLKDSTIEELKEARDSFDEDTIAAATRLNERINAVKDLLNNHKAPSAILMFLED